MAIEIVATDFDGTFVCSDHTIRDDTVDAYHHLQKKVKVVLCTGRVITKAKEAVAKFKPGLDFTFFPGVYCHGAVVFDKDETDFISKDTIDFTHLCEMVDEVYRVKEHFIANHRKHIAAGVDCPKHSFVYPSSIKDINTVTITLYKPLGIYVDFEPEEMAAFGKRHEEKPDKVFNRRFAHEDLRDVLYFAVIAHPCFLWQLSNHIKEVSLPRMGGEIRSILPVAESLHVLKRGVSKAEGLKRLCAAKGWAPDRVLAIGDAENDIEMLKWATCSIAMGNSTKAIQDAAKYVTDCANEGGWARAMQKHVLNIS